MELRKIDLDNVWQIVRLTVSDEQKAQDFVASNAESIIEAYAAMQSGFTALPFGIYESGKPVGFVMLGYGSIGDEKEPAVVDDSYCVWRFMIDAKYQKHGYGMEAMREVLRYIRTFPCGKANWCWLSYEPDNDAAKSLYAKFGFKETGETDGDEVIAVLKL